ncbi:hypothetical protein [Anaerocolumna chitinilytica]|nr:hypothetical protein [Anaerocolumna chitinilytica]
MWFIQKSDITENEKIVDTAEFEGMYAKKDSSNLSMYQDYSIDFPDDIKKDRRGEDSADNWEEITLYNTNGDIYLNNILIEDAKLYSPEGEYTWTKEGTNDRFMWHHTQYKKIDYACTRIREQKMDSELLLDLDMNHR